MQAHLKILHENCAVSSDLFYFISFHFIFNRLSVEQLIKFDRSAMTYKVPFIFSFHFCINNVLYIFLEKNC